MTEHSIVIDALERAPGIVVPLVREVPADILRRRPAPRKWSAHEHACHLAHVHRLFVDRLDYMLASPSPVITPYEPGESDPDDLLLSMDLEDCLRRYVEDRQRLEIVFDTLDSTRKAQNLRRNSRIALTIGGLTAGDERTVQFEGVADEPGGVELETLKQVYYAAYPDGPTRLSWPGLIYIRIRPTWIRYSDYNARPPEIIEFREAGRADVDAMAKAHRDSIQSMGPSFYSSESVAAWQEGVRGELYLEAMDRNEVFFIATRGDEVLGFASDYPIDGDKHGASAYVRGSAARHGIGSTLLCLAEARARLRGARSVEIEASLAGVDFYRRHGFVEMGAATRF